MLPQDILIKEVNEWDAATAAQRRKEGPLVDRLALPGIITAGANCLPPGAKRFRGTSSVVQSASWPAGASLIDSGIALMPNSSFEADGVAAARFQRQASADAFFKL